MLVPRNILSSLVTMPFVPGGILLLIGPLLVGVCMNWCLWGLLTVQIYYYSTFFKDSWHMHILVYSLYLVDSIQVFINMDIVFDLLCNNWGNAERLLTPGWALCTMPIFSGLVSFPVQCFFAARIWNLRASWKSLLSQIAIKCIIIFVILCGLAQALCAIIAGARMIVIGNITKISILNAYISIWLGGSTVCDTVITITLLLLLRSARKEAHWKETKSLIDSLIQQTVQTGLITTFAASVELILFLVSNKTYLHTIFACILGKLYTNSLMATLNSRAWNRTNKEFSTLKEEGSLNIGNRSTVGSNVPGRVLVCHVDHVHHIHSDIDSSTVAPSFFASRS